MLRKDSNPPPSSVFPAHSSDVRPLGEWASVVVYQAGINRLRRWSELMNDDADLTRQRNP